MSGHACACIMHLYFRNLYLSWQTTSPSPFPCMCACAHTLTWSHHYAKSTLLIHQTKLITTFSSCLSPTANPPSSLFPLPLPAKLGSPPIPVNPSSYGDFPASPQISPKVSLTCRYTAGMSRHPNFHSHTHGELVKGGGRQGEKKRGRRQMPLLFLGLLLLLLGFLY